MTRVAIITGGGQGMGAAAAAAFLRDGFAGVVLVDRNASGLATSEAQLAAPGRVATVTADLMEKATPGMAVAAAMEKFGRVDVLVNAAGTSERCSIDDVTHEAFERIFTVNVRAPVFMMQEAARAMRKTGGGVVINISSMLAYGGPPDIGIYASSKAALVAATRNAANAWKAQGIRVFRHQPRLGQFRGRACTANRLPQAAAELGGAGGAEGALRAADRASRCGGCLLIPGVATSADDDGCHH
jgi:NAD(P)-dependent dehydrogenase (short-subunit alcohol dehydrogenase family)